MAWAGPPRKRLSPARSHSSPLSRALSRSRHQTSAPPHSGLQSSRLHSKGALGPGALAGYGFEFGFPLQSRLVGQAWLRFVQRSGAMVDLDIRYRTSKGRNATCLVTVDGPLPAMQQFARELPELAITFCRIRRSTGRRALRLLRTFLRRNASALKEMTKSVYQVSSFFGGSPPQLSISVPLAAAAKSRDLSRRERSAVRQIIDCIEGLMSGRLRYGQGLMLSDQAAEDWVKARLPNPPRYFPASVDRAVAEGILSRAEAYRLRRYHSARNRAQHRAAVAVKRTALAAVTGTARIMEARYV
jgi:hypothetical protein